MEGKDEAESRRRPRIQNVLILLILVVSIAASAYALVTVGSMSQIPPSDFVTLPTTPLSKNGTSVLFVSVSAISQKTVAVGVKGYLTAASGAPVAGAKVYMTYYLQGAYRTQVATTNQDGSFEANFPMNWTGWLPVTLTYFGDLQHQGLIEDFNVSGEGP